MVKSLKTFPGLGETAKISNVFYLCKPPLLIAPDFDHVTESGLPEFCISAKLKSRAAFFQATRLSIAHAKTRGFPTPPRDRFGFFSGILPSHI
jgi:hypothetical protein